MLGAQLVAAMLMDSGRMCLANKTKAPVLRYGGTLLTYIAAFLIFDRSELPITCIKQHTEHKCQILEYLYYFRYRRLLTSTEQYSSRIKDSRESEWYIKIKFGPRSKQNPSLLQKRVR
jgi:hypothetical protein